MAGGQVPDVAIVGGGAAGCVLARRLADADRSVLLLEAGPDLRGATPGPLRDGWHNPTAADWATDWGYRSEPDGDGGTAPLRRGRLLGGTSWLTRFAVRGAPADYDAWAARGNPGWSFEEVLPTFRLLEADRDFGRDAWHGADGPMPVGRYLERAPSRVHAAALEGLAALGVPAVADHNRPGAVGVGRMPMSTRDGQRVTALDAYLGGGWSSGRLTIRTDVAVASVLVDDGRATGVLLGDGSEIAAGWVILSAGTYGSPTLLLHSGIGPAHHLREVGVGVRVDLPGVGENLADHPGVDLDSGWTGEETPEPMHSIATFRSSLAGEDAAPDLLFWLIDPEGDEPGFYLDPILMKPESRGHVRLRSADPGDAPRITLPHLEAARDVERLAEGYQLGLELANCPELREVVSGAPPTAPKSPEELRRRVREGAYSLPHVVGTCRMGPLPDAGDVVDALGRVHGVDRLSVIDASVIPEPPSGFPHLITIMLAEHLSLRLPTLL